ncbi:hypothetical protein GCM10023083_61010 [Streptomyces phyllanthi]
MLPLCGRAPVRALFSSHGWSASMGVRGSARCTGSSGLGDTAAYIPAGGGTVRGANSASRTARRLCVAQGLYGACASFASVGRFGRKSTVPRKGDYRSDHAS